MNYTRKKKPHISNRHIKQEREKVVAKSIDSLIENESLLSETIQISGSSFCNMCRQHSDLKSQDRMKLNNTLGTYIPEVLLTTECNLFKKITEYSIPILITTAKK